MTGALVQLGLAGLFAGGAFVLDTVRAKTLTDILSAGLPPRLARWARPIAVGATATCPDGETLLEWGKFCAAVMDRESLGGTGNGYSPYGEWNGQGDGGHAETPWQLDRRYHAAYLARTDRTPERDSVYACGLLASGFRSAVKAGADPQSDEALSVAAASFNSGRALAAWRDTHDLAAVDNTTTGRDYGADVLRRLEAFA